MPSESTPRHGACRIYTSAWQGISRGPLATSEGASPPVCGEHRISQHAREGVRENRSAKAKLGERGVQSCTQKRRQEHIIRRTLHVRLVQMSRTALGVIPYLAASCAHSRQCRCACATKRRMRRTSRFAHVIHLAVSRAWSAHAHLGAHCVPLDVVALQLEDLCCTLGRKGSGFHSQHLIVGSRHDGRDVHRHVQLLRLACLTGGCSGRHLFL